MVMVRGAATDDVWIESKGGCLQSSSKICVRTFFLRKKMRSGFQNGALTIRTAPLPVYLLLQVAIGLESLTDGKNANNLVLSGHKLPC